MCNVIFVVVFSALTLGILKRKYLSHVGCDSLSPEAKTCLRRVVEEELLNMQDTQVRW